VNFRCKYSKGRIQKSIGNYPTGVTVVTIPLRRFIGEVIDIHNEDKNPLLYHKRNMKVIP
jgi:flavin reductase (DIM6/NTAB) family NADH-FMN oxidoreductase RutF